MIIDVHTHFGDCYQTRDGLDPSRWMEDLRSAGVDRAVVFGLRILRMPACDAERANDEIAEVVARTNGFAVGLGIVHPFSGQDAIAEADRSVRVLGMKGIKLHPWLQGFPTLFAPQVYDLCDWCAEQGVPLLLHDGTSNTSLPSQIGMLAKRHPRTTFILGHGGLLHLWRSAAEVAARFPNVYLTMCGPHPAALRHIFQTVPVERLLWGSDAGIAFVNYASYRKGLVDCLELAPEAYTAIMSGNVQHLLNWQAAEA